MLNLLHQFSGFIYTLITKPSLVMQHMISISAALLTMYSCDIFAGKNFYKTYSSVFFLPWPYGPIITVLIMIIFGALWFLWMRYYAYILKPTPHTLEDTRSLKEILWDRHVSIRCSLWKEFCALPKTGSRMDRVRKTCLFLRDAALTTTFLNSFTVFYFVYHTMLGRLASVLVYIIYLNCIFTRQSFMGGISFWSAFLIGASFGSRWAVIYGARWEWFRPYLIKGIGDISYEIYVGSNPGSKAAGLNPETLGGLIIPVSSAIVVAAGVYFEIKTETEAHKERTAVETAAQKELLALEHDYKKSLNNYETSNAMDLDDHKVSNILLVMQASQSSKGSAPTLRERVDLAFTPFNHKVSIVEAPEVVPQVAPEVAPEVIPEVVGVLSQGAQELFDKFFGGN